ncbi:hypothetical protein PR202_gb25436 [Eleusine coracana subsp. coracana]|uniref:Uncharacterized protein n=1 Tax=Eleusine coracana subsp. coracana TaxID=191504 RepID=A0AAV5FP53_ELECO|nr:hypothetical protein PR202_gb25436 [Eleusine coracana subsp. coracana]
MTSTPRGFLHGRCGSRQLRADQGIEAWGGVDSLVELSESMCQAASLLADYDPFDDPRRPSTFLDAIVLGNGVCACPASLTLPSSARRPI